VSGDLQQTYSTKEAAERLGVSVDTVYNYLRRKKLKSSQPGSTGRHRHGGAPHRIPKAEVDALLTARDYDEAPPPAERVREMYEQKPATASPSKPDEPMWTRKEAAAATGLSVQTIRRREGKGLTPYTDGGQIVRYRASEVLRMFKPKSREAYEAKKEDGDE